MDSTKINEYIRLYDLAVTAVSDKSLLPNRSDAEIKGLISSAGWLGLREDGESKEEAAKSSKPNIWIDINEIEESNRYPDAIDEDIREPGLRIGLYFNTISAMRNAKTLLESHNSTKKDELLEALSCLDDIYQTRLRRKTKPYNYAQTPEYETVLKFRTNQINNERIIELFEKSDQIEAEGRAKMDAKVVVQEFPSLDLVYVKLGKYDAEFVKRIKEVFSIYKIARNIKSQKMYAKAEVERKQMANEARAKEFGNYVEELNKMRIRPEQRIELRERWLTDHPLEDYLQTP